jgi:hypothetical protein
MKEHQNTRRWLWWYATLIGVLLTQIILYAWLTAEWQ